MGLKLVFHFMDLFEVKERHRERERKKDRLKHFESISYGFSFDQSHFFSPTFKHTMKYTFYFISVVDGWKDIRVICNSVDSMKKKSMQTNRLIMQVPKGEMKYRNEIPNPTKYMHEYKFACVFCGYCLVQWSLECSCNLLMCSIYSKHQYDVFFCADVSDKMVPAHSDKAINTLSFPPCVQCSLKWLQILTECIVRCESRGKKGLHRSLWIHSFTPILHLIVYVRAHIHNICTW